MSSEVAYEFTTQEEGYEGLNGLYFEAEMFHGRPTFMMHGGACVIYYYDARDGAERSGWWLGKEVGGKDKYCHCCREDLLPP